MSPTIPPVAEAGHGISVKRTGAARIGPVRAERPVVRAGVIVPGRVGPASAEDAGATVRIGGGPAGTTSAGTAPAGLGRSGRAAVSGAVPEEAARKGPEVGRAAEGRVARRAEALSGGPRGASDRGRSGPRSRTCLIR